MIYFIRILILWHDKWKHRRSFAIGKIKKLTLLKSPMTVGFHDPKIKSFLVQLVAEMFSYHTNKGMLTDSYTAILIEIDIERSLEVINRITDFADCKSIALNYKVLDCHSSGLTLRGGLSSFIFEAVSVNKSRLNDIKRGLDAVYRCVRKTDK